MNIAENVAEFLIHTIFTLYIVLVMLRMLLALARADFYNPLSQFIVTATSPVLTPLRKLIPSIGKVDTASLLLMLLLKIIELSLLVSLGRRFALAIPVQAILELLILVVWIYIFAIFIQAIASWITPGLGNPNPAISLLRSLTEPLLRPVRRVIPSIGMIDLSSMIVIIGLYVALIVLQSIQYAQ